jgi:hypothetical protein
MSPRYREDNVSTSLFSNRVPNIITPCQWLADSKTTSGCFKWTYGMRWTCKELEGGSRGLLKGIYWRSLERRRKKTLKTFGQDRGTQRIQAWSLPLGYGWTIGVLGFDSRRGTGIFLFTASRTALGHTQPPIQWVPRVLSRGVKRPGRETDHSPPTSAEVKEWVELHLQSPSTPPWRSAQLKHRDNFTSALLSTQHNRYFTWSSNQIWVFFKKKKKRPVVRKKITFVNPWVLECTFRILLDSTLYLQKRMCFY